MNESKMLKSARLHALGTVFRNEFPPQNESALAAKKAMLSWSVVGIFYALLKTNSAQLNLGVLTGELASPTITAAFLVGVILYYCFVFCLANDWGQWKRLGYESCQYMNEVNRLFANNLVSCAISAAGLNCAVAKDRLKTGNKLKSDKEYLPFGQSSMMVDLDDIDNVGSVESKLIETGYFTLNAGNLSFYRPVEADDLVFFNSYWRMCRRYNFQAVANYVMPVVFSILSVGALVFKIGLM